MASEKWSNPTVCLVPMSWPTEYARHLDVRTTSIYPLPKMSPDRALERMRKGRGQGGRQSRHLGPCDDRNKRAVVGGYGIVPGFTRYPSSTSSAPNATTSAMVAEWTTSPCAYVWTVP